MVFREPTALSYIELLYKGINKYMRDTIASTSEKITKDREDAQSGVRPLVELYHYNPQSGIVGFNEAPNGETFESMKALYVGLNIWPEHIMQITRAEYDEYIMLRDNPRC